MTGLETQPLTEMQGCIQKQNETMKKMTGKTSKIPMIMLMFDSSYLSCFSTDSQKIGDGLKDLEKIFKMGPIWHFQLYLFKSYEQNKGNYENRRKNG